MSDRAICAEDEVLLVAPPMAEWRVTRHRKAAVLFEGERKGSSSGWSTVSITTAERARASELADSRRTAYDDVVARAFRPSKGLSALQQYVKGRGTSLDNSTPRDAFGLMFGFFEEEDCTTTALADGDMLLYQWGIYDWGKGPRFELDLTRQWMVPGGDDDIWQLRLTFLFPPSESAHELGTGDRWCDSRAHLVEFTEFVRSSAPFVMLAERTDGELRVELERV